MKLAIYGTGTLSHEVYLLVQQINQKNTQKWESVIFIEDINKIETFKGCKVVTKDVFLKEFSQEDYKCVVALGEPYLRNKTYLALKHEGCHFATLIHPNAIVPKETFVGEGVVIGALSFISCDVTIGANAYIQPCACIAHDCVIGQSSVISTYASISGNCKIGQQTYISPNVPIKNDITIGDHVIVGMGSVVLENIENEMTVMGNPARVMRKNEEKSVFKKRKKKSNSMVLNEPIKNDNNEKYKNAFMDALEVTEAELCELEYQLSDQWDSIAHLSLITELEEVFDFSLKTEDIAKINSFQKGIEILSQYGIVV